MTENEMLKIALHCLGVQAEQEVCEECDIYGNCHTDCKDVAAVAIKALKEIQRYREIGSVGEIKQAIGVLSLSENDIIKTFHELNEYHKIGTVKECREAREKQKPKAPKDELKINPVIDCNGAYVDADTTVYLLCPNCGEMVGIDENVDKFCRECGQAIDWEESEE